ncbi:MAG: hydroxyphenylacetyl-CoA thioesterase PaaI [Acidimicrobiales bacterium]
MYASDASSHHLGIEVVEVGPGRAVTTMTVAPTMVNGHGIVHGGYLFLLADTAFAFACNSHGEATVARSADIVFVQPAHAGDTLVATAKERLRYGRDSRNGVSDVTIRRSDGTVVAEFRGQSRSLGRPLVEGGQGDGSGHEGDAAPDAVSRRSGTADRREGPAGQGPEGRPGA